jgi:tetrahydromethanopterin S-methyltransferase subunit G
MEYLEKYMAATPTTDLEKTSLEAHVDLCALRYAQLDKRLTTLESKVDSMHSEIVSGQKSLVKVIIGTAGTITAGILSVVIAILMKAA